MIRVNHILVLLFLGLGITAHAGSVLIPEDSFEYLHPENNGWGYTQGACGKSPCPYLDITSEAAYAGSRALKLFYPPDSATGTSSQAIYKYFSAPVNEAYNRYWYRTVGFTYEPSTGTKQIYWRGDGFGTGVPNGGSIFSFGSREMSMALQGIAGACPPGSSGGTGGTCNLYPNQPTRMPLADNTWYCIEEHINLGTPGGNNGAVDVWINGIKTVGYANIAILPSTTLGPNNSSSLAKLNEHRIYKQAGIGIKYIDQYMASTTRIGCSGTPPPVVIDLTPPAAPIGVTVK